MGPQWERVLRKWETTEGGGEESRDPFLSRGDVWDSVSGRGSIVSETSTLGSPVESGSFPRPPLHPAHLTLVLRLKCTFLL